MKMNFEEIKKQFDIYDVAVHQLELELRHIGGGEYRGVSPSPGQHHTDDALAINTERQEWYDFSTKEGGSVLDLVAYVKYGSTDTHSIAEAARLLAGDNYDSAYWEKRQQQRNEFCVNISKWHNALMKDERTLNYLHERRITNETINALSLGLIHEYLHIGNELVQEWRLACPYLDAGGKPIYMASRRLDWAAHEDSPKYHKLKQSEFLRNALFGLNTIPYKDSECDTLFIGEGLFDAVSLIQEGYHALFTIGGAAGKENDEKILQQARRFRRLITAFDSDYSGQKFTISYGRKFLNAGLYFECIPSYGEGHKDVSDYYTDNGNLQELVDRSVNGYVFMSRYSFWETQPKLLSEYCPFKSLSPNEKAIALAEVKKFIHKLQTFIDDDDMIQILDALKEYYPSDKIKKIAEGMSQEELMMMMRDDFLEGKHIFFHGTVKGGSYYEYQPAGYWARLTDASMQSEVSAHFNHSKSNKDIFNLTTMIRHMHTRKSMPEFNSKSLCLLQNGVFDFNTGELRQPKPDDYLTWQVGYAYDENATCPLFDKFLAECANNEPSRIDFLNDMLGYIPFENNRLERIFFLIGEGNNGKSTFLHVLEHLIRNTNKQENSQSVTHIQPSMFDKPTELMQLEGSIINIAYDISPNLKGCESHLKSVASGDVVSGNHKFCDTVNFRPRCKLIFSSNHMIKVNDDSLGMRRKLMFCKFENNFTGHEDTHLEEKLIAELPGIFNKMFRAYKALLEREKELRRNAIRACCDNDELMTEFNQIANPVAAFWSEHKDNYLRQGEIKKSKIFDDFKAFCERNGRFAGDERQFHKKFKRVASDDGITIQDTRHRENGVQPSYCHFNGLTTTETTAHKNITLDDVLNDTNLEVDV
ncbi:MAG: toprim domain-containing protein [Synergistaceae bacterium]|nr:toprim domain-containing protein [Synergistaceae bacterium]